LEEGRLVELLVLNNFGDSLTCCPANSPLIRHVLDTQVRQAAKWVAECKEGSYAPKANEVCLAKFTGKNSFTYLMWLPTFVEADRHFSVASVTHCL
jgi:hypothetical protein